jgi:hypothetical protein
MEELARRNLIRPVTQEHIGHVLPESPGVNFAMVREFGGSNFTIPVGYSESLLIP